MTINNCKFCWKIYNCNNGDNNNKGNSNENIRSTIGNSYKILYNWSKWINKDEFIINSILLERFEKIKCINGDHNDYDNGITGRQKWSIDTTTA